MSGPVALGAHQLDALREIGNIGAGTAATALSQLTGRPVQMGVPTVVMVPVEEAADRVAEPTDIVAVVLVPVSGDVDGHMLIVMGERGAREMVGLLMGGMVPPEAGGFSEIELSALQEVGNILTSSYLGALAQLTGLHLEPAPPAVGVDMAAALLGAALAEVATEAPVVLLLESPLSDGDSASDGDVIFIPTSAGLTVILERLGLGG